jgi:uncharacterized MAPEG superfamily protein
MSSLITKTNISLYTLPVSWILCLLPRFYAAYTYTTSTSKPLDMLLPRALAARASADPALQHATRDRIVRAEAAQANGLENVGYFAAAVVAGNMAGLNKGLINCLSVGYLISRGLYSWLYVFGDTKTMAIARTGVFFGGQGLIWTLFILAGYKMR